MADLDHRKRIAKLVRQFGATERGVRANAWRATERAMEEMGANWSDIGNWIEHDDEPKRDDGKYTESEMQEYGQATRAEGLEAGIKIGQARASNGGGNGHLVLPKPNEMAEYCHERLGRLKNDNERTFVGDMYVITQRGVRLSLGRLGYLASLYIQTGGKV